MENAALPQNEILPGYSVDTESWHDAAEVDWIIKGLSSNGIGRYFLNEKTAVEDFERKVYRVEAVQPCGRSLVLNQLAVWRLGSAGKEWVPQGWGSTHTVLGSEPLFQGVHIDLNRNIFM